MLDYYIDDLGVAHLRHDSRHARVWRLVMHHHLDVCHANGLDAIEAASLLINAAGYVLGAYLSEQPVAREQFKEQMITVFRGKVDQAVEEGRADRKDRGHSADR